MWKICIPPSFQIARLAQADREFGRAVDQVINTVIKIPAVLPLAALLDSHGVGIISALITNLLLLIL
jgi:hypothetical protein